MPIGRPVSFVDGPSKRLVLASMLTRVLVKPWLTICGKKCVRVSLSELSEALWSRAQSVWSEDSVRGSGQTILDRRIWVAFFLDGNVGTYSRSYESRT
jgi:hypothetical protein